MIAAMFAAAALLAGGSPAAGAPAATTTADARPAPKAKTNDLVCRKEALLGSNIPQKVCYSRSEDAANRQESRMTLERMQAMSRPPGGH
ncbi:MAG: hypothetical protein KGO51_16415 [Alphaproteobacteria bacterium]|nr:hypothetical protein [Alphaproteobacteria bacterium]